MNMKTSAPQRSLLEKPLAQAIASLAKFKQHRSTHHLRVEAPSSRLPALPSVLYSRRRLKENGRVYSEWEVHSALKPLKESRQANGHLRLRSLKGFESQHSQAYHQQQVLHGLRNTLRHYNY